VFGNVGTTVSFRVGADADADLLEKKFNPIFDRDDIMRLPNYNTITQMLIGGVPTQPFSMATVPPLGEPNDELARALKQLTAAKYGRPRAEVEAEIMERLTTKPVASKTGAGLGGSSFGSKPTGSGFGASGSAGSGASSPKPGGSFLDDWLAKRKAEGKAGSLAGGLTGSSGSAAKPGFGAGGSPAGAPGLNRPGFGQSAGASMGGQTQAPFGQNNQGQFAQVQGSGFGASNYGQTAPQQQFQPQNNQNYASGFQQPQLGQAPMQAGGAPFNQQQFQPPYAQAPMSTVQHGGYQPQNYPAPSAQQPQQQFNQPYGQYQAPYSPQASQFGSQQPQGASGAQGMPSASQVSALASSDSTTNYSNQNFGTQPTVAGLQSGVPGNLSSGNSVFQQAGFGNLGAPQQPYAVPSDQPSSDQAPVEDKSGVIFSQAATSDNQQGVRPEALQGEAKRVQPPPKKVFNLNMDDKQGYPPVQEGSENKPPESAQQQVGSAETTKVPSKSPSNNQNQGQTQQSSDELSRQEKKRNKKKRQKKNRQQRQLEAQQGAPQLPPNSKSDSQKGKSGVSARPTRDNEVIADLEKELGAKDQSNDVHARGEAKQSSEPVLGLQSEKIEDIEKQLKQAEKSDVSQGGKSESASISTQSQSVKRDPVPQGKEPADELIANIEKELKAEPEGGKTGSQDVLEPAQKGESATASGDVGESTKVTLDKISDKKTKDDSAKDLKKDAKKRNLDEHVDVFLRDGEDHSHDTIVIDKDGNFYQRDEG
jgi:hypothetical protein